MAFIVLAYMLSTNSCSLSLLCLVDMFISFSLSGKPVNWLGVAKCIEPYKQHLNIWVQQSKMCSCKFYLTLSIILL